MRRYYIVRAFTLALCLLCLGDCGGHGALGTHSGGLFPHPIRKFGSDSSTVPRHVLTAAFANGYGGTTLRPDETAPYLSWANNPSDGSLSAIHAAGMMSFTYTNPNRQYQSSPMWPVVSTTPEYQAADCAGNTITVSSYGGGIVTNILNQDFWSLWRQQMLASQAAVAPESWDAYYEDDAGHIAFSDNGFPCNYTDAQWVDATVQMTAAAGVPIIVAGDSYLVEEVSPFNAVGGLFEGCYGIRDAWGISGDGLSDLSKDWVSIENIEIGLAQLQKLFFCMAINMDAASTSYNFRTYVDASFLLTYDPSTSVLWESYRTPSALPVMPESQLVPLDPLVATPSDVSMLRTETGVFGREYAHCYVSGVLVGACAVIVNPDPSTSHEYPYGTKYQHTLVMDGGGVIEGGTISTNGPPPPSPLGAASATIVFE